MFENVSDNFNEFFELARDDLKENKIKLSLRNSKRIKIGDDWCNGYFNKKELAVAAKSDSLVEIFTHEYCHFLQYKENSPLWDAIQNNNIFYCIENRSFGKKWYDSICNTIAVERDCEMRVLKINREFNLFNEVWYAKYANAYLYFHQYVYVTKSWKGNCTHPEIVASMPSKIVSLKKLQTIDSKIINLFSKVA